MDGRARWTMQGGCHQYTFIIDGIWSNLAGQRVVLFGRRAVSAANFPKSHDRRGIMKNRKIFGRRVFQDFAKTREVLIGFRRVLGPCDSWEERLHTRETRGNDRIHLHRSAVTLNYGNAVEGTAGDLHRSAVHFQALPRDRQLNAGSH